MVIEIHIVLHMVYVTIAQALILLVNYRPVYFLLFVLYLEELMPYRTSYRLFDDCPNTHRLSMDRYFDYCFCS